MSRATRLSSVPCLDLRPFLRPHRPGLLSSPVQGSEVSCPTPSQPPFLDPWDEVSRVPDKGPSTCDSMPVREESPALISFS